MNNVEVREANNSIHFTVKTDHIMSYEEAVQLQIEAGFHPAGYDGPWNFHQTITKEGEPYTYKWHCAASCD